MKKIALALVAFMLVLGMTQCKKEQQPSNAAADEGETVYITMKVADNGDKHTVYPSTGAVVYGSGDKIYVGNNGHYVGTLTYSNGTFSGSITSPSTSDYLHFYFTGSKTPAPNPTAGSTTSFTVDISDQSSKLPVLSYGHSTSKYIDGTTAYTCMLENKCGLVKFIPSIATSEPIIVSGMKTVATIDFATPGITPTEATGEVTLYSYINGGYWAILLPQDEVENPTVNIDGYTSTIASVPLVTPNMYYSTGVEISMYAPPTGAIDALFTINADGDQVYFSKGNLQYIGSASTPYWKFAENQLDYIGTAQESSEANIDRDLFYWGTSGYNHGATCYQPWEVLGGASSYNAYGDSNKNLFDETGQADWGYNAISNGGNQENLWRTLTRDEWWYLFGKRQTQSGIRYVMLRLRSGIGINTKYTEGIILFPDNWDASYYPLSHYNSYYEDFTELTISIDNWTTYIEPHGAVFLPAAGTSSSSSYYNNGQYSVFSSSFYYWTSTTVSNNGNKANVVDYMPYQTQTMFKNQGAAVRLVQDVE